VNCELIITVKELINKYGSEIYTDSRKLKSFLSDYYPEKYLREKRLITDSVEQKVPEAIINCNGMEIDDFLYNNLIKKLYDNLGISEDLAEKTIDFWCGIFNKTHTKIMNQGCNTSNNLSAANNSHLGNLSNNGGTNFSDNGAPINNGPLPNNMYNGQSRPGTSANYSQQNYSMNTVLMNNTPVSNGAVNNTSLDNSLLQNKNFKMIMIGMSLFMLVAIVVVAYSLGMNKDNYAKKTSATEGTKQANSADNTDTKNETSANSKKQEENTKVKANNFIFSESSTTKIPPYKLYNLSSDQLFIARNEIFARHGYIFKDKAVQDYFESQAWYKPNPDAKGETTDEIEKDNVQTIRDMEEIKLVFKNSTSINRSYVLSNSDIIKLTSEEIDRLSDLEILIARNEIFARHGYIFGVPELNNYFQSKSWYTKISNNVTLNEVEEYNIQLLKDAEDKRVYNMLYNYKLGNSY